PPPKPLPSAFSATDCGADGAWQTRLQPEAARETRRLPCATLDPTCAGCMAFGPESYRGSNPSSSRRQWSDRRPTHLPAHVGRYGVPCSRHASLTGSHDDNAAVPFPDAGPTQALAYG